MVSANPVFNGWDSGKRLLVIQKLTATALFTGILMSANLWFVNSTFPDIPLLNSVLYPADKGFVYALLCVTLLLIAKKATRTYLITFLLLLTVLIIHDQMRLQPWVYLYGLIFMLFGLTRDQSASEAESLVMNLQLLIIGVYLWSGIHKLNPAFIELIYFPFLQKIIHIDNPGLWKYTGYCIPLIEILAAILLFIPSFRKKGVWLTFLAQVAILVYISPLGIDDNYIVVLWNLAMTGFVLLLFLGTGNKITLRPSKFNAGWMLILLLLYLLPVLNFFGYWDHYLSFSLYSSKPKRLFVAVSDDQVNKLEGKFDKYFIELPGLSGGKIINIEKWAMDELNVPVYPEERVFKVISKSFCNYSIPDDRLIFMKCKLPVSAKNIQTSRCSDLP